jgi:ParB-like chromosome segregation protein Spo0J
MTPGKVTVINAADLAAFGSLRPGPSHHMFVDYVGEGDLALFPGNARRGQVDKLVESIKVNGFYTPLIVQRSTGYIIAGNHRFRAAQQAGITSFPVVYLDVDDAAALKINVADNKLSDDATYDVDDLIDQLQTVDDLDGTGWTEAELAELLDQDDDLEDDEAPADSKPTVVQCPQCSHTFDPNLNRVDA